MPQVEKSGYKKFWPMRQFAGRGPKGEKVAIEGFRDMVTGEFHHDGNGWNGKPPELPSGEKDATTSSSRTFVDNYPAIFGHD